MGRPHPVEWRWRNADNRAHNPSSRVKIGSATPPLRSLYAHVRFHPIRTTLSSDKSRHPEIISIQSLENLLYDRLHDRPPISISRERLKSRLADITYARAYT